jgi:epoxyqueuosine reductase
MTAAQARPEDNKSAIRERALALGFDAIGFASAELGDQTRQHLREFLGAGLQGDMGWMREKADRRGDPKLLWPEARTIVALGVNYAPEGDPLERLRRRDTGALSVYAHNRDYHDTVKKRLKVLARWMAEHLHVQVKVFVDTAPVMEKPLAQAAGLGWQGKHTNLVSRAFGSWLFLGEIFTDLDLAPDAAEEDHCGECRRCLDICPTNAFPAPYRLDARRCISYLTIEHKGPIASDLRPLMGNRIYGCDDCLAVCPWNKFAKTSAEPDFLPRAALTGPKLADLAGLDDAAFRRLFSGSPVKRIGRARFVRNVLIAIGNSADPGLAQAAEARLNDPSPLVRGAAIWALGRLSPKKIQDISINYLNSEGDPDVRSEWCAALA